AEKRVDFEYNALSQFTGIKRYSDLAGEQLAVDTTFGYDEFARLGSISHAMPGSEKTVGHIYTRDDLGRISTATHSRTGEDDVTDTFNYDATSQLTGAEHDDQDDESYVHDLNGNRRANGSMAQDVGTNNQLLNDGNYAYKYDDEGNRTQRILLEDG